MDTIFRASSKLKAIMKDKKVTTKRLAEMLGLGTSTLYNTFSNDGMEDRSGMTFENAVRLADALGCDIIFKDRETGKEY